MQKLTIMPTSELTNTEKAELETRILSRFPVTSIKKSLLWHVQMQPYDWSEDDDEFTYELVNEGMISLAWHE